jgi:uncharacterized BrkB/YihY/UPF0761 family membrane protein
MDSVFKNVVRALARIFPDCVTLCQAIAFNMFLAFFPLLLFSLGFMAITSHFVDAVREIPDRLSLILPPGSMTVVAAYFVRRVLRPWRWMIFGLLGTMLAGTQVMAGYMEGFRIIEGDLLGPTYWRRQLRALSLLCLTIVPMLSVVVLTVYGRQIRQWLMLETGSVSVARVLEVAVFAGAVFPWRWARSCFSTASAGRAIGGSSICSPEQRFPLSCGGPSTFPSASTCARCLTISSTAGWRQPSVCFSGCF